MAFTGTLDKCSVCDKTVYFMDLLTADGITYHKSCFKCSHCKGTLVVWSRIHTHSFFSSFTILFIRINFWLCTKRVDDEIPFLFLLNFYVHEEVFDELLHGRWATTLPWMAPFTAKLTLISFSRNPETLAKTSNHVRQLYISFLWHLGFWVHIFADYFRFDHINSKVKRELYGKSFDWFLSI